jgi:hypothetical protein
VAGRLDTLSCIFAPCAVASCLLPLGHSFRKRYLVNHLALLANTLAHAGGGFQKLGQWLSMRPDQFDEDVIAALSSLRDDGPRHSFRHTRQVVESAFGCRLEEMFERFDELPVASGSKCCVFVRRIHARKHNAPANIQAYIGSSGGRGRGVFVSCVGVCVGRYRSSWQ